MSLLLRYRSGTHRVATPDETLKRIAPILPACGITRCADLTRLDVTGVPVYTAIRPTAMVQQVSNGKGLTSANAKVSALMESIELFHAEEPEPARLKRASAVGLGVDMDRIVLLKQLENASNRYFSRNYVIDWVEGQDLRNGEDVWAPASAVYFGCYPAVVTTSTNGLASGNHPLEARLHAIYELLERDATAKLVDKSGRLRIGDHAKLIDPDTIDNDEIRSLLAAIDESSSSLYLFAIASEVQVHNFWSVLVDPASMASTTGVNMGWGTHVEPTVAACRAITEAIQSRLGMIQGSREDIQFKPAFESSLTDHAKVIGYYRKLVPHTGWDEILANGDGTSGDLREDYDNLIEDVTRAGYPLFSFDLMKPGIDVPVVKVLAPTMKLNLRFY